VLLADFIASIDSVAPFRVDGIAVFLTAATDGVPHALVHNMKANQSLHKTNILLNVRVLEVPRIPAHERVDHKALEQGFHVVTMRFGFAEETDVPSVLREAAMGFDFDAGPVTYFISRGQAVAKRFSGMARWRASLFAFLMRNASPATARFHLPENGLIEIGVPIDV